MSRSGYSDDFDGWSLIRWRGQVASAIKGKRGQAFLKELVEALDTIPEKRLIEDEFWNGESCALAAVAVKRGIDVITLDAEDNDRLSDLLNIARPLVMEVEFLNDECGRYKETPEQRWHRMRAWATSLIR